MYTKNDRDLAEDKKEKDVRFNGVDKESNNAG